MVTAFGIRGVRKLQSCGMGKTKFLLFRRFSRVVITSVCQRSRKNLVLKRSFRAKKVPRRMRMKRVLTAVLIKLYVKAA